MGQKANRGKGAGARAEAQTASGNGWTGREKMFLGTTIVCLIAAVVGFVLYAGARVPAGVAAKVNDIYVQESDVAQMISEQRARYGLESDADFASSLLMQGMNVYTYRQGIINQIALNTIIDNKAKELGCTPSDSQVDEQVKAMREMNNAQDDESWQKVLDAQGVTEQSLRAQLKTNLSEQAIYEKEIQYTEATDDEIRSYVATNRAGGVAKHSWRATFSGTDAEKRAKEFRETVLAQTGPLTAETFSLLASKYSDSPTVAQDGGDAGWTYLDGSTSYAKALADLQVGALSEVVATDTDGNYGVAYCDEIYEFPDASDASSMDLTAIPDDLMEDLREQASAYVYETKCNEYLAALLSDASFTYYPIPKGAVYNVDMNLAQMAAGTYLDNIG